MAYLKAAGKALINSPKAIRKKLGGNQDDVQKHERECNIIVVLGCTYQLFASCFLLCGATCLLWHSIELEEDWYHSDDPINAGISFYVKVGKTIIVSCMSLY